MAGFKPATPKQKNGPQAIGSRVRFQLFPAVFEHCLCNNIRYLVVEAAGVEPKPKVFSSCQYFL
jgi:hypothetical protein